jgi:transmembrane sensor
MSLSKDRISYLLQAWTSRKATMAEEQELFDCMNAKGNENVVNDHITKLVKEYKSNNLLPSMEWENIYQQILQKRKIDGFESTAYKTPIIRRIAVAASIIMAIATTYFVISRRSEKSQPEIATTTVPNDVNAPAANRAMITLADGRVVYLDSVENGSLATQGNVKLIKLENGKIAYQTASGEIVKEVQYNTLSNPRGSKVIDMTLSDGSKVWLNAGSSIKYPVAFIGDQRKVTMKGEGYFEIVKDLKKKFLVEANGTTTEVLGTQFNINAYNDEQEVKVTLLEGSVKISTTQQLTNSKILKPGQQAQIANGVKVVSGIDIEEVMSWKNGIFKFKDASIETIMKQMEKWYDVQAVYEGKITEHFISTIPRTVPVSEVLKILETTGKVKFQIEGNKIVVTP